MLFWLFVVACVLFLFFGLMLVISLLLDGDLFFERIFASERPEMRDIISKNRWRQDSFIVYYGVRVFIGAAIYLVLFWIYRWVVVI